LRAWSACRASVTLAVLVGGMLPASAALASPASSSPAPPGFLAVATSSAISRPPLATVPPAPSARSAPKSAPASPAVRSSPSLPAKPAAAPPAATAGDALVPVSAAQLVSGKQASAGTPLAVTVTGHGGIPGSGVGAKEPTATSASVGSGRTATALVPVPAGTGGKVSAAISAGQANVTVDEVGYYIIDRSPALCMTSETWPIPASSRTSSTTSGALTTR
jgi:hypothetical protein